MKFSFNDSLFLDICITIVSYLLYIVNLYNLYITPGIPYRNQLLTYAFWGFPLICLFFAAKNFIRLSKGQPAVKPFLAIHLSALILFVSFFMMIFSKAA